MFYYLVTTLYVFVCLVLLAVILLQQGKGGDMASAFGGGSSQTAFGARTGATVLSKMTAGFAVLFMIGALVLAIMGQRGPGSVLSGSTPPPPPSSSPTTPGPTPLGASPGQPPATAPGQAPAAAPAQSPGAAPAAPAAPTQTSPATPPATPPR